MSQTAHFSSDRRSLLRGRFELPREMRPPGAAPDPTFHDLCTRCGDCAAACPQAIITADQDGFPKIDVSARSCLFCNDCADACETGAIKSAEGWDYRPVIAEPQCLSVQGVTCRACEDHCEEQAIRFRLMTAGRSRPLIDMDACTGCGACVAPCPSSAISLTHPTPTSPPNTHPASESQTCTISADV